MRDEIHFVDDGIAPPLRRRLTARRIVLGIVVCAACFALAEGLLQYRSYVDELARAFRCETHLHQIGVAMEKYQSAYGTLPPAVTYAPDGKPLHSWRALILPYLENGKYAGKYLYDEPWNGPHNQKLVGVPIEAFVCPNHREFVDKGLTSYLAVVGPTTSFPPGGKPRSIDAITDGANDTILLVETKTLGVPWTKPVDLDFNKMSFTLDDPAAPSVSSRDTEGVHVLKVSGRVAILKGPISPETLRAYLTVDGKESVDPF
jgi:hypothetical protein